MSWFTDRLDDTDPGYGTHQLQKVEERSRIEPVSQLDLAHYLGGGTTWSDIDVDRLTVMGVPVVWACIKVLSESLASFPLVLYEGTEEGETRKRAENHPLYDLLHSEPNPQQDMFMFKEQAMGHLGIYGNFYANIIRNGTGYVQELWPLNPERIFAFRINGELLYRYRASPYFQTQDLFFRWLQDSGIEVRAVEVRDLYSRWLEEWEGEHEKEIREGTYVWKTMGDKQFGHGNQIPGYFFTSAYASYPDQVESILTEDEVFHVRGMGFDGIRGYSPLEVQMQTFGLALGVKHFSADYFKNGGNPEVVFEHEHHLSEAAAKRLANSWRENHSRWGQKHKPIILEEGMKMAETGKDPDKTQMIPVQTFLVAEIARIYRIPPHLLQDLSRATFSNIEHQAIEFVQHTMRPWVLRWESAISRQLLSVKDRKKFYPQFLMDAILRGDAKARSEFYTALIGCGMLSPNEGRRMEQWNDRDGGDTYYVPLNWQSAEAPAEPETQPDTTDTSNIEPSNPAEASGLSTPEQRTLRSVRSRRKTANTFENLLKEATARIVRKEKRDNIKALNEHVKNRSASSYDTWIKSYYDSLPDYIKQQVTPVYQAFSNAIKTEISNEIDINDDVNPRDEHLVREYVDAFTKRYIGSSKGQLQEILTKTNPSDMYDQVSGRLDEWDNTRADKTADHEKVQASNAFAKNIYKMAGVSSLIWASSS